MNISSRCASPGCVEFSVYFVEGERTAAFDIADAIAALQRAITQLQRGDSKSAQMSAGCAFARISEDVGP